MIKETPSLGRLLAMAVFAMSCFGILMFLWLAFGGSIPLRPEGYRFQAAFGEAATLAVEADVRLAGVNVGKVKSKELDKGSARTIVEMELEGDYSPIPADTRAILRQKTLLGETYVELSPGRRGARKLPDGGRLANANVEPTVELDEIFNAFDRPTREAFQDWVAELSKAVAGGRGQDLNDALGNLEGFAVDGAMLLKTLDEQEVALRGVIKNTGVVFGAINEREGALRDLIVSANELFGATASRDEALAETFRVFPTFLDESKATLGRLERFAGDTRPLVNALKAPGRDLAPTVRDLGDLAPNLEGLFRDLDPLIDVSEETVPDLERFLRAGEPVFESAHLFFPELNPILSLLSFHQVTVAGFISNGASNLSGDFGGGERVQAQIGVISGASFARPTVRAPTERGNAYPAPNIITRAVRLGTFESFDCKPAGGQQKNAVDAEERPFPAKDAAKRPPCFVQPPSLYSGKRFNFLRKGKAPLRRPPRGAAGSLPADPDRR